MEALQNDTDAFKNAWMTGILVYTMKREIECILTSDKAIYFSIEESTCVTSDGHVHDISFSKISSQISL